MVGIRVRPSRPQESLHLEPEPQRKLYMLRNLTCGRGLEMHTISMGAKMRILEG